MVAACSESGFPLVSDRLEGTFVLTDIDGMPLPADAPNDTDAGNEMMTSVVADTIEFYANGFGIWRSVWRRRFLSGAPADSGRSQTNFRYGRDDTELRLWSCRRTCDPTYPTLAYLTATGELRRPYRGGRELFAEWNYRRVASESAP